MSESNQGGKAQSCRSFSSFEDYKKRKGITDDLPEDQKMDRLINLFNCFSVAATKASDNLQPGEFEKRIQLDPALMKQRTDVQGEVSNCMTDLLEVTAHSLELLQACRDEMEKSPLSRVNGTSLAFAECVQACREQETRFAKSLKTAETHGLLKQIPEKVEKMRSKISCALTQLVAAFLFVPDMINN